MKAIHVALFAGAAAAVLVLALVLGRPGPGPTPDKALLLPALQTQVNDVDAIVIQPGGAEPFRIERGEAAWTLPGHDGYPADAGKVRRLVLRLADARILETKTSNPDLYERLGVEDVTGDGGTGVAVTLDGVDNAGPVIIGKREAKSGRGTYVRRAGEPTAWLVDQVLVVDPGEADWLDRQVMDIPADDVASLSITHPDGDTLLVERGEDGRLGLSSLPEGRQLSGPTAPDALARALTALRLDDVRPVGALDDSRDPVVAKFTLTDGTVIQADSRTTDKETWTVFHVMPGPGGDDKNTDARTRLAERVEGWAYRLPEWKAEQLTRRTDSLLKPLGEKP